MATTVVGDPDDKSVGILGVLGFLFIPLLYYIWKCYRGQRGTPSKDAHARPLPHINDHERISGPNSQLVSDIGTTEYSSG
jgi:hypothetical protein